MINIRWPSLLSNLRTTTSRRTPHFSSKLIRSRSLCTSTPTLTPKAKNFLHLYRASVLAVPLALAFGIPFLGSSKSLQCATESRSYAKPEADDDVLKSLNSTAGQSGHAAGEYTTEESILSVRDLSFGTVAGICVGVFIKKGLKVVAFVFGGTFVLLQYFASRSFIKIDWNKIGTSYETKLTNLTGSKPGTNRITSLYALFADFITAGFQSRATLLLGIALGFRLG